MSDAFDPDAYLAPAAQPKQDDFDPNAYLVAPQEKPSVGPDIAKSGLAGLARGTLGLAGLPGDIGSLASAATAKLGSLAGVDPVTVEAFKQRASQGLSQNIFTAPFSKGPTTSELTGVVEKLAGPIYQPKTTAGEYAQTVGEFVPGLIGGGESLAAKALMRVAAPAIASETAGQLTKGTAAEPYARIVGAIGGGTLPTLTQRLSAPNPASLLPTHVELKTAARAAYQNPIVTELEIKPSAVTTKADDIIADLDRMGLRQRNAPTVYAAVEDLKNPVGTSVVTGGPAAKIADIDSVRKELGHTAKEVNLIGKPTAEAMAAKTAIKHIDDFVTNIAPADVLSGNAKKASELLQEARENYSAAMHMADVDARLTRAERQAAKSGTGGNIDNAIRQKISAILDVSGRTRGYTTDEIQQMEKVVRGTPSANLFRLLGKFGVSGGLSLLLHAGMALPTGGATIPIAAAGTIARKIAEGITARNAGKIGEMIAARSPLGKTTQLMPQLAATQLIPQWPNWYRTLANTSSASIPARMPNPISGMGQ